MQSQLVQKKIKLALKDYLRKQKYTYSDVAQVWKCSIPTVKRQLGTEELAFGRLLEILEWLGLTLAEIEKMAESDRLEAPRFSQKQIEFLAKDQKALEFLLKLYAELTPEQIAKKYQIPAREMEKILILLEKHDLIRVSGGGVVRAALNPLPKFEGELAKVTFRRQVDQFAEYQKRRMLDIIQRRERGIFSDKGTNSWGLYDVSTETFDIYAKKFAQLLNEFGEAAKLDTRLRKKTELQKAVLNYTMILNENTEPSLKLVEGIFESALHDHS